MDSNVVFGGSSTWDTVTEETRSVAFCVDITCTLNVTFSAARKDPYWFRVYAQNQLGTGAYVFTNEQSVQTPSVTTDLTVQLIGPRTVFLQWVQQADTGVGGAVRTLGNYTL